VTAVAAAGRPSPLRAGFEVTRRDRWHATVTMTVRPDEPVFAGHYPAFPILPGVCVIEHIRLGALATIPAAGPGWDMTEIGRARFLGPVFPGDRLTTDLDWTPGDGCWWCAATAATQHGIAAKVKLGFAGRDQP
jgi:3-hydroxyacyl-[acyl-carrier-protein] dehydratase